MPTLRSTFLALIIVFLICSCGSDKKTAVQRAGDSTGNEAVIKKDEEKTILFFGNSLTAGYGVDPSEAFPALIQIKIDSLNLPYKVINAGVSGETSSGGNSRIEWILRQPVDVFILELGANDGLRGIPMDETRKNLQQIVDKVKAKNAAIKLVVTGMQIPPNMGQDYINEFRSLYPELAKKNNMSIIPFLLEGVGGEADLNQEDGIHPTAEGHMILAENVWKVLKPLL